MTLAEVQATGKVALCQLPSGAQLRYEPGDGTIRTLPYPGLPRQWREASAYTAAPPAEGWTHYRGCDCPVCEGRGEEPAERRRA